MRNPVKSVREALINLSQQLDRMESDPLVKELQSQLAECDRYAKEQYKAYDEKLAEVTAERDKLKEGLKKNWPEAELLDNAYKEIDRLKAELKYAMDHTFMTDRDAWKQKAERLAEACDIETHKQFPSWSNIIKALSEFEAENK